MPTSGCTLGTHKLSAELGQLSFLGEHKLRYELSWRDLHDLSDMVRGLRPTCNRRKQK